MGRQERRERERDLVRAKILDAARELFAEHGYEGVSMRGIAEKIEYSPTVIYQHFKDKETLIKELCYADFGRLAGELQAVLEIADPVEQLKFCGEGYVRFAIANPNHYRLMFMTPKLVREGEPIGPDHTLENKGNPKTDAYALLRLLVKGAAEAGRLRDREADVDVVAQTLWAGLHGVIALEIVMRYDEWTPRRPLEDRVAIMLNTLTYGLFEEKR